MLGLLPFLLLHVFLVACMIKKFSPQYYMHSIYTAPKWAKLLSFVGIGGWWVYCALCADWIRNSYNLEFNGWIGFAITGATMLVLTTGDWGEE